MTGDLETAGEAPTRTGSGALRWRTLQVILVILAVAGTLALIYALRKIILLLVLSAIFAFLLAPLVRLFERPFPLRGRRRSLPRPAAVAAVYLAMLLGIIVLTEFLVPRLTDQVIALMRNSSQYTNRLQEYAETFRSLPTRYRLPPVWSKTIGETANHGFSGIMNSFSHVAVQAVHLTTYLPWLALIPILAFFWLKDATFFQQKLIESLPKSSWRWRAAAFLSDISDALAAYIRTLVLSSLIVGAIAIGGLSVLGAPYPVVLGTLAGLLESIPLVGPFSIIVVATLFAAFQSLRTAMLVLVFLLALRGAQDYVIYPRLISRSIEMHPLLVVVAVLCGAELAGVIGIFLSVPVTALLLVTWRHVQELHSA